ncbi:hypothetical protein [Streptomyces sp. NPDC001774]
MLESTADLIAGATRIGAASTRYDKRGDVFLGTSTAAALLIWRRT